MAVNNHVVVLWVMAQSSLVRFRKKMLTPSSEQTWRSMFIWRFHYFWAATWPTTYQSTRCHKPKDHKTNLNVLRVRNHPVYCIQSCQWTYSHGNNTWHYTKRGQGQRRRYRESLRTGRSGDRIPVGGKARFSAPVQTGPVVHPDSGTGVKGLSPRVKGPGRGVNHPPLSTAEVKEEVELYFYSPSEPSWPVLGWALGRLHTHRQNRSRVRLHRRMQCK